MLPRLFTFVVSGLLFFQPFVAFSSAQLLRAPLLIEFPLLFDPHDLATSLRSSAQGRDKPLKTNISTSNFSRQDVASVVTGFDLSTSEAISYIPLASDIAYPADHVNQIRQKQLDLDYFPLAFSETYRDQKGMFFGARVVADILKASISSDGNIQNNGQTTLSVIPRFGLFFGYQPSVHYRWVTSLDYLAYNDSNILERYGAASQDAFGLSLSYFWLF